MRRTTKTEDSPHDEDQLVPLALSLVVFHVVNTPSALLFRQLLDKGLKVGRSGLVEPDLLQRGDGLHTLAHAVDDKLVLLAELELIVGLETGFVLDRRLQD
jgi:hypothetical protein